MAWKDGPLPPDVWGWGGVALAGEPGGFYFADFCGDHAKLVPGGRQVRGADVAHYDNSLTLPPSGGAARIGG